MFGFPALHSEPPWVFAPRKGVSGDGDSDPTENVVRMTGVETSSMVDSVQTWRYKVDSRQHGFFLAKKQRNNSTQDVGNISDRSTARTTSHPALSYTWEIGCLSEFENGFFNDVGEEDQFVAFADPSTYPQNPGWMLRNLLVIVRMRWNLDKVQIVCYRDTQARRDDAKTIILRIQIAPRASSEVIPLKAFNMPKVTGWERNNDGKVTSRVANLGEYMDPQRYLYAVFHPSIALIFCTRLADQAVDLNLKLIKWRIAPTLNLEKIKDAKCLLLGAGTLGSYVSRNLLV